MPSNQDSYLTLLGGVAQTEAGYRELFSSLDNDAEMFLGAVKKRYQHGPIKVPNKEYPENYPNRFLFDYGHVLTASQLERLLSDKEIKQAFYQDFLIHGFTYKLSKWPEELINTFYDAYVDEHHTELMSLLLQYTARANSIWFDKHVSLALDIDYEKLTSGRIFAMFSGFTEGQKSLFLTKLLTEPGMKKVECADHAVIKTLLSNIASFVQFRQVLFNEAVLEKLTVAKEQETNFHYDLLHCILRKDFSAEQVNELVADSKVQALLHGEYVLKSMLTPQSQGNNTSTLQRSTQRIILGNQVVNDEFNVSVRTSFDTLILKQIFSKEFDTLGRGFFKPKLPSHLKKMRCLLGPKANIKSPLGDDTRRELLVIAEGAGNRSHWWFNSRDHRVQTLYELIRENTAVDTKCQKLQESANVLSS